MVEKQKKKYELKDSVSACKFEESHPKQIYFIFCMNTQMFANLE